MKIYGYARISTKKQNIERQIENILKEYPNAVIYREIFTGTTTKNRTEWAKLKNQIKENDTIVFDSVSRMSRNSIEGIKEYMELMDKKIKLIFLKEPYINTDIYQEQIKMNENIKTNDTDLNETLLKGVREYLKRLAKKQIEIAFDQAEKEVTDLKQRTKEGLKQAKIKGSVLGRREGTKVETKKAKEMKAKIQKLSKDFNGNLKDTEIIGLLGIARNTFYKYKKDIKNI